MPINMDPKRKRRPEAEQGSEREANAKTSQGRETSSDPAAPTEADLAEKEWKNLWEATEVIDMDTW